MESFENDVNRPEDAPNPSDQSPTEPADGPSKTAEHPSPAEKFEHRVHVGEILATGYTAVTLAVGQAAATAPTSPIFNPALLPESHQATTRNAGPSEHHDPLTLKAPDGSVFTVAGADGTPLPGDPWQIAGTRADHPAEAAIRGVPTTPDSPLKGFLPDDLQAYQTEREIDQTFTEDKAGVGKEPEDPLPRNVARNVEQTITEVTDHTPVDLDDPEGLTPPPGIEEATTQAVESLDGPPLSADTPNRDHRRHPDGDTPDNVAAEAGQWWHGGRPS